VNIVPEYRQGGMSGYGLRRCLIDAQGDIKGLLKLGEHKSIKPVRQIEAAQLMTAMNNFTQHYMRSIVVATPEELLSAPRAKFGGLNDQKLKVMKQESANLEREFRSIEQTYSADHLDLTLSMGYVARLLGNIRVVKYLAQHYPDIFEEFRKQSEINH
jgi:hypothetical protein